MNIFQGGGINPEKALPELLAELRNAFAPWIRRVENVWEPMLDPSLDRSDLITDREPLRVQDRRTLHRRSRSQYRSNFIETGHTQLVNRMLRSRLKVEVGLLAGVGDMQIAEQSSLERFLLGVMNDNEAQQRGRFGPKGWKERAIGSFFFPGKGCAMIDVRSDPQNEGYLKVQIEILDPLTVYHDFDSPGVFIVEKQGVSIQDLLSTIRNLPAEDTYVDGFAPPPTDGVGPGLLARYGIDGKARHGVMVADVWWEEEQPKGGLVVYNALLCGQQIKKGGSIVFCRRMWNERIPAVAIAVNGSSSWPQGHGQNGAGSAFMERHGRPWFAPLDRTMGHYDLAKSLEMDGIEMMLRPPLIVKSEDGLLHIQDERFGPGVQIPLKFNDVIEFLKFQNSAVLAESTIIASLERDMKAVLSDVMRGELGSQSSSGYLFNQQSDAVENAVVHYGGPDAAIPAFFERCLAEVVHQLKRRGGKVRIAVDNPRGQSMGHVYYGDFDVADLPKSFVIRVRTPIELPKDDLRAMQIFREATTSGALNKTLARGTILGVDDPVAVEDAIQEDRMWDSPQMQSLVMLRRMRHNYQRLYQLVDSAGDASEKAGLTLEATIGEMEYRALSQSLLGGGQGQPQPRAPVGVGPEQQPPQEQGANNPEVQRALLGQPPPGGRPSMGSPGA